MDLEFLVNEIEENKNKQIILISSSGYFKACLINYYHNRNLQLEVVEFIVGKKRIILEREEVQSWGVTRDEIHIFIN